MSFPQTTQPMLPPNTIIPVDEDFFIPYFNRLYEDIAYAVNSRDPKQFPMAITSTAQNIPNIPNFGAFIICVSGVDSTLPTATASLCKSDAGAAGVGGIAILGSQIGTGAWAGKNIVFSVTPSNFQIAHDRAGATGNFNIRVIGTQG